MNFYLSYGAGVGSEALRLWLLENEWPHEAVYVDHGCDWPETQEFVKTIPNLTIIKPKSRGFDNLYKHCIHYKMVPSLHPRWCTVEFKIIPFNKYVKHPCIVYLGYTIDEAHRAKQSEQEDILYHYPLIAMRWTRKDCEAYIKSQNMPVPMRSMCWLCPQQTQGEWKLLRKRHLDLYNKVKELERLNMEYRKAKGKEPLSLKPGGKLEDITQERQIELF